MAKLGGKYETIFVVDSTLTDEATAAIVEKFKTLVEQNATLGEVNEWGKRRLAYPIDYKNEGYYVLVNFAAAPELPAELERNFKIDDSILRYLVTRMPE